MTDTGGAMANVWSLVLAAGEGTRLQSLTTCEYGKVPKQFCSLRGGTSLLHEALARASGVSDRQHTCVVVAEEHRRWWDLSLRHLPEANVVVQPCNRGTGHGILLPLLHILERDRAARLVIFPSDHYVQHEAVLLGAVRRALGWLEDSDETLLLGMQPQQSDSELGYIVPGHARGRDVHAVRQFVEKPPESLVRELIDHGALWNSFIVAGRAQALLSLYRRCVPRLLSEMRAALWCDRATEGHAGRLSQLYQGLPQLDFCRHVLDGQEQHLGVLRVPHCGWSDLGTPRRVALALRASLREEAYHESHDEGSAEVSGTAPEEGLMAQSFARGYLNLAAQFEALKHAD